MDRVEEEDQADTAGIPLFVAPPVSAVQPRESAADRDARKRSLRTDLVTLGLIGVLLVGALAATWSVIYRELYSPTAFVGRYLSLLEHGRAADALAMPGVAVDSAVLDNAGLPSDATAALLRRDALGSLTDVKITSAVPSGDTTEVTASYRAGGHKGVTSFSVESNGWIGVAPSWRFATTPLSVITVAVHGSMQFELNGFAIDKRQVSPAGAEVNPSSPIPMLVFSPGLYSITVDSPLTRSAGVAVLADEPLVTTPVALQTQPTDAFTALVQKNVESFLTSCTEQKVLQPTGCPFGFVVRNRIVEPPTWTITAMPKIKLVPDGAAWSIGRTQAVAHIDVDVQMIYDGSIRHVSEDVPFVITGPVLIRPDGTVSIQVSTADPADDL